MQTQVNKTTDSLPREKIFIYQFFYSTAQFSYKGFGQKFCHGGLKQKKWK